MKYNKALFIVILGLLSAVSLHCQERPPLFKDGDVVCFIGNSITHGGSYHTLLQLYNATRYPNEKIRYFNCGISGDNASGMISRFKDDVLIHKPTHAFLMTGMNDINVALYTAEAVSKAQLKQRSRALSAYYKNTEKLANLLIENKIKPIFLTPTIYDETAEIGGENHPGANKALAACAKHIRRLAKKYNAPLIDLYTILYTINREGQKTDPSFTIIGPDRVHPKDPGHFVMAQEIIKTLYPQEYISRLYIDANKAEISTARNCTAKLIERKNALEIHVQENALPFPLDSVLRETLMRIPGHGEMNQHILKVKGIKRGTYTLYIDDIKVAEVLSKQLKKGLNLAQFKLAPQYKQAERISQLCFDTRELQAKLRTIRLIELKNLSNYKGDGSLEDKREYLAEKCERQKGKSWYPYMIKTTEQYFELLPKRNEIETEINNLRSRIYAENKPQWHTYRLLKNSSSQDD